MTRAYGSPKAFLIAMGVLMALAVVAAAVAWWFLERVAQEVKAGGPPLPVPRILTASGSSGRPDEGEPRFVVRLDFDPQGRVEARIGELVVGPLDDARTLDEIRRHAREARRRAGAAADSVSAEVRRADGVASEDVVRVVDALVAAEMRDVTFVGAPDVGTDRLRGASETK